MFSPDVAGTAVMLPSSFLLIAVIHTSCGLLAGQFLNSRQELLWQLAGSKAATGLLTGDAAAHIPHRQTYARALRLITSFMALLRAVALGCAMGSLFLGLLSPSCADEGIRSCAASLVISVLSAMASLKLMALLCAAALLGAAMLARDTSWKSRAGKSMDGQPCLCPLKLRPRDASVRLHPSMLLRPPGLTLSIHVFVS